LGDHHGDEEGRSMGLRDLGYRLYERRLAVSLSPDAIPRHVGVMCDGNRRWAKSAGFRDVSNGHRKGADKIFELLDWCRESGVEVVTLWLLSTDNLTRSATELVPLLKIIEDTVQGLVAEHWHVNPVGALDLLPAETVQVLKDAADATAHYPGLLVNVAVGYGGRREIADAVRSLLQDHATRGTTIEELAEVLDVEHIAEHLYTAGQPDPDLVIRTSCSGRAPIRSSTSAMPTGRPSARSISSGHFGRMPPVIGDSDPKRASLSALGTPRARLAGRRRPAFLSRS
jgi:short-chain Z-isoprenyl diphosphate synthase